MVKTSVLAIALVSVGAHAHALSAAVVAPDTYPNYCDRLYHGSPASSFSYFFVAPNTLVGRYITFDPNLGWCGYPTDPRTSRLVGFSRPEFAVEVARQATVLSVRY